MTTETTAALYLRSAAQNDDAIEEQRRVCEEHAAARGWRIGEIFVDNGASGMKDRPGLQALRDCLADGRASVVVAKDVERIARDLDLLASFARHCEEHGVRIACVDVEVDTATLAQMMTPPTTAALRRAYSARRMAR